MAAPNEKSIWLQPHSDLRRSNQEVHRNSIFDPERLRHDPEFGWGHKASGTVWLSLRGSSAHGSGSCDLAGMYAIYPS
eukprot:scaffold240_cov369-Pavlova_lutheri.AAC.13